MAEPRTTRGRERKSAIIAAAAALMYERGVRATSVDEVLVASGAGKSQFYHYFSNKHDLVAAVLEHQLATVLGELGQYRLDTWRGLRAWFDALLDGQQQRGFNGCPLGSLAIELSASGPDMQRRVEQAFARWEDALADAFESMKASHALHPSAPPAALAQATLAAIQGGYLLSTAHQEIRPMQTALSAAYTHIRANRLTQ